MSRIRTMIAGLGLLAASPPCFAAAIVMPPYCTTAQALQREVPDCTSNELVVTASQNCVTGLNNQVQVTQKKLTALMAKEALVERSGQKGDLQNTRADLESTIASLQSLLREARLVRGEVWLYHEEVISFPDGITKREAAAMRATEVLSSFECFADSQKAVLADIANIDRKIAELTTAANASAAMAGKAKTSITNLVNDSVNGTKLLGGQNAAGIANSKKTGPSTITGKIDDERVASAAASAKGTAASKNSVILSGASARKSEQSEIQGSKALHRTAEEEKVIGSEQREIARAGEVSIKEQSEIIVPSWLELAQQEGSSSEVKAIEVLETAAPQSDANAPLVRDLIVLQKQGNSAAQEAEKAAAAEGVDMVTLFQRTHFAYERLVRKKSI